MSNPKPSACSVDNCEKPVRNKALCNAHYLRMKRHGSFDLPKHQYELPCTVEGCNKLRRGNGLCDKHYTRMKNHGSPHVVKIPHELHGMHDHPLYKTWNNMKNRCYCTTTANYQNYGARGIQVCDRWRNSFSAFVADVGERPKGHTLDRIDNNGNYEPGNVRWARQTVQSKNTKLRRDNKSGHKGVSWDSTQKRWRVYTGGGKSRVERGYFSDLAEAIYARHMATLNDPHMNCCAELAAMRAGERGVA